MSTRTVPKRHSLSLKIKNVDEDERIIEGIASTRSVDRVGDVVEPEGATYNLPLPLLLDHDHSKAIGAVEEVRLTGDGIWFRARIAKSEAPGPVRDLVDSAWHLVRAGLRRTVSIGFRALPGGLEALSTGGYRFKLWEWLELSLVAIPAQPDAQITGMKRMKGAQRKNSARVIKLEPKYIDAARKKSRRVVRLAPRKNRVVKLDHA